MAKGGGVPENNIEAYAWVFLAKYRWNEEVVDEIMDEVAGGLIEALENLLTAEQRAEGQARAAELYRKIPRE